LPGAINKAPRNLRWDKLKKLSLFVLIQIKEKFPLIHAPDSRYN